MGHPRLEDVDDDTPAIEPDGPLGSDVEDPVDCYIDRASSSGDTSVIDPT